MRLREAQASGAWRAFRRGFHQRNPLVLAAALVLLATTLLVIEGLVRDGWFLRVSEGRFVRFRNDDSGHLAYRMASLTASPPEGSVVYLLGGSATMESFLDERSLAEAVSKNAGERVKVISLAGHAETLGGSLTLVENLPRGDGLLAVGLSPARFTASPQDDADLVLGYPYLLRSPRLRAILEETPARLAPADTVSLGLIKYGATYLQERVRTRLVPLADVGYSKHYTIDGPLYSRAQKLEWARGDVERDADLYSQNAGYNFAVLEELVELARERGFDVVFFDQPINPDIIGPTWRGLIPAYRRRALALADRLDVPYLRVAQRVHLENGDFLDAYHLVVRGRLKWQPVLSKELALRLTTREAAASDRAPAAP